MIFPLRELRSHLRNGKRSVACRKMAKGRRSVVNSGRGGLQRGIFIGFIYSGTSAGARLLKASVRAGHLAPLKRQAPA
jgi:hypothetical protein